MAKTLFNLRLDDERLRWVRGYAVQRGTSASGVVVAAIDLLRGMATGGVPDVPLELPPRDSRAKPSRSARPAGPPSVPEGPDIGPTPEGMDFGVHHALVRRQQAAARNARMREKGSR